MRRGVTRGEAADYLGLSLSTFDHWVRSGRIPGAIEGTRRWDVRAIDAALDRLSGLNHDSDGANAYDEWKAAHAGAPQRHTPGQGSSR